MNRLYLVNDVLKFIELNVDKDITLDNLEKQFNYSKRHLRRIFREKTNVSLYGYIIYRKLVHALYEIVNTEQKLIDISSKYGWNNYDSFARSFKKYFDISPNEAINNGFVMEKREIVNDVYGPVLINNDKDFICDLKRRDYRDKHYWFNGSNKTKPYIIIINGQGKDVREYKINMGFDVEDIYCFDYNDLDNFDNDKYDFSKNHQKVIYVVSSNLNYHKIKSFTKKLEQKNNLIIPINITDNNYKGISNFIYSLNWSLNNNLLSAFTYETLKEHITTESRIDAKVYRSNYKNTIVKHETNDMPKQQFVLCVSNNNRVNKKIEKLKKAYSSTIFELYNSDLFKKEYYEVLEISVY